MPKPATPREPMPMLGSPGASGLQRLMQIIGIGGEGSDVRLPMPSSGQRDPRLPPPSPFEMIRQGLDQVQDLGRPTPESMSGLQRAAGRK